MQSKDKAYYVDVKFGTQIRKIICTHPQEMMKFLQQMSIMLEEGDYIEVYCHNQVDRLDGFTSLQKIVLFDGGKKELVEMIDMH